MQILLVFRHFYIFLFIEDKILCFLFIFKGKLTKFWNLISFVSIASKQVLFFFKRRSLISAAPEAVEIKLINKPVNEDLKNLSN